MNINMATTIDNLAREAADPLAAGRMMRQLYLTHCKLTNRQLTVDLLSKMVQFKVGTHEVEKMSLSLIKGEERRNPEIVTTLLKIKLEDAFKWKVKIKKQFLREKEELYKIINRGGLLKETFWTALRLEADRRWREGKKKNLKKISRLEVTYKGAKPYTGMVGNIRVGDQELEGRRGPAPWLEEQGRGQLEGGHHPARRLEDQLVEKVPLAAGARINQAEAKVLNLDPKFRNWSKITMEDVETDIDVGLDNLRRTINQVEENGGVTLSVEQEERERSKTNPVNFEAKEVDFGRQRSTAMKQNKYFSMAKPVNGRDEMRIQTLKDRLLGTSKKVLSKTNDSKGLPKESCYTEEERVGVRSLVGRRREEGLVVCETDKSQSCGVMAEEQWLESLAPHTTQDPVVAMEEVGKAEKQMMGVAFQGARALGWGEGHNQGDKVRNNLRSESVSIPNLTAQIKDHKEVEEGTPVKVRPVVGVVEAPCGQLSNMLSEVVNSLTLFENSQKSECKSSEEMRAAVKGVNARGLDVQNATRGLDLQDATQGLEVQGAARGLDVQQGGVEREPQPAWRLDGQRVVGSTDFKSYYPQASSGKGCQGGQGYGGGVRGDNQNKQHGAGSVPGLHHGEGGGGGAGAGGGGAHQAPRRRRSPWDHLKGNPKQRTSLPY